jgi:hypothetical protein
MKWYQFMRRVIERCEDTSLEPPHDHDPVYHCYENEPLYYQDDEGVIRIKHRIGQTVRKYPPNEDH